MLTLIVGSVTGYQDFDGLKFFQKTWEGFRMTKRISILTNAKKARVIQLRIEGHSYRSISNLCGISRGSAHNIIKRLGYDPIVRPEWKGSFKDFLGKKKTISHSAGLDG
jgi:hypothetical protein